MMKHLILIFIISFSLNGFAQIDTAKIEMDARDYYEKENYQKAKEFYSYLIKLNPNNQKYYYGRGLAFMRLEKTNMARSDFNKGIKIATEKINNDPNNSENYADRGSLKMEAETNKGGLSALTDFVKAIKLNPNEPKYDLAIGSILFSLGEYTLSLISYNQALAKDPEDYTIYSDRGFPKNALGDYDGACKDWIVFKELNNDSLVRLENYADELLSKYCGKFMLNNNLNYQDIVTEVLNISPQDSKYLIDSINRYNTFNVVNKYKKLELGDSIMTIPINLCKNSVFKLKIKVLVDGSIRVVSILQGSSNPAINNLVVSKINSSNFVWTPVLVDNVPQEYLTTVTYNLFKKSNSKSKCESNEKYYQFGVDQYLNKQYGLAKESFKDAISYNSRDLDSYFNLGMTFLKLEKMEKACDCFKISMKYGDRASYDQFKKNCSD